MKVAGFSFIRNAIKFDYPIVEAIQSILPFCDKVFVAVGNSEDETRKLIEQISSKVEIIDTTWDDSLREGGRVLAVETDKALNAITNEFDWAFYIQGDEVFHEDGIVNLQKAMTQNLNNKQVDGLLVKYRHFYGSYDYLGDATKWYRREIRVVRPNIGVYSYKDAQGFRKPINQKLNVKLVDAYMHHYGWVKDPTAMQKKAVEFNKLWHDDNWIEQNIRKADIFDYSEIDALRKFEGTHPAVMEDRLKRLNWKFDYDIARNNYSTKDKLKLWIEKLSGYRIGEYRNYKLV
jgi:hypothetical protein